MRPLVTRYGWEQVWRTGLDVLGYPPTWAQESATAAKLAEALSKPKQGTEERANDYE